MTLIGRRAGRPVARAAVALPLHYELIPAKSFDRAMAELPDRAHVSVTCSPAKGIGATQECTARLLDLGHQPVPHLAARMVEDRAHAARLARWVRTCSLDEVFVIAGDIPQPLGRYEGALAFMSDLLDGDPGVRRIGVPGYPEGHPSISPQVVDDQLAAKHRLLTSAGIGGWVSTQMCFDPDTIAAWIRRQRECHIDLPVRLGVPGLVDRTKLVTMGARLGIGASLRYLSKNTSTVARLVAPGGYDPTALVTAFAGEIDALGIEALHAFTFNDVARTRAWHDSVMAA